MGTITSTKRDCLKWDIGYAGFTKAITDVHLLDYEQNFIEALSFSSLLIQVDLSDYGDGAYVLELFWDDNTISYVSIFDLCNAMNCYKQLFRYILCKCDDPCNDCDESIRVREYDMNSIMGLTTAIKEMIYLEQSQYAGIYSMTDTREGQVEEVGAMIDKLSIITDRCGLCSGGQSNFVNCP